MLCCWSLVVSAYCDAAAAAAAAAALKAKPIRGSSTKNLLHVVAGCKGDSHTNSHCKSIHTTGRRFYGKPLDSRAQPGRLVVVGALAVAAARPA